MRSKERARIPYSLRAAIEPALVLFCMPNAVLVVVKGPVVAGASALAEKPCYFGKSRIVLVDQDRMDGES
jgi:hypothetical protein